MRVVSAEEIRNLEINEMQVFPKPFIYPGLLATVYGLDIKQLSAEELLRLVTLYMDIAPQLSAFSKLQIDVVNRILNEKLIAIFENSSLKPQIKHFVGLRARLQLLSAVGGRHMPNWLPEPAVPSSIDDAYVWKQLREKDGELLFKQPGDYEQFRGIVAQDLEQQQDITAHVDEETSRLTAYLGVIVVGRSAAGWLNDPASLTPFADATLSIPVDKRQEFEKLYAEKLERDKRLPELGTLRVSVTLDDEVLAGASVGIYSSTTGYTVTKATTNDEGVVEVELPAKTAYQVGCRVGSTRPDLDWDGVLSPTHGGVIVPPRSVTEQRFAAYRIRGAMMQAPSLPAGGVQITLLTAPAAHESHGPYAVRVSTSSDLATGQFELSAFPGPYILQYAFAGTTRTIDIVVPDGPLDLDEVPVS